MLTQGARIHRLEGRDLAGRDLMRMAYAQWQPGAFGLGIHRATLFQILRDAALAEGLDVRTGTEIVDFDGLNRPTLRDAAARHHGPFDMVVVADGSGSRLRQRLRPRARAPLNAWGAVWSNAEDRAGAFSGALHQRYDRASTMIGILPIGSAPDGRRNLVSFFWSLPVAQMDTFLGEGLDDWRREVIGAWPEAEPIVQQNETPASFARATYRDVRAGPWAIGDFVLIGDAAHGTSPQLGQGANLGLIDAVELAERVDGPARLAGYQRARRLQTAPYQLFSRLLTPLFQSHGAWGPWIRRWLFAPLAQAPGLNRLAAVVLTGVFRLGPTPGVLKP